MVNTALKNANNFLFKTQNTVISAATIIALSTGLSAFLGLFKGRILTYFFGVSSDLAIFYTADRIPNLVYSVLVVGALSTIFIPVFTSLRNKDESKAWHTASTMINASMVFFVILGLGAFVWAREIMTVLSFDKFSGPEILMGSRLMQIMLAAQLILVFSSFLSTILQSFKFFLIPAIAPVMYNVGMILGTVVLAPEFGIYAPAFGVMVGAMLHLLIQLPFIRNVHFKYSLNIDLRDKGIRQIFSMMPYRIISVLITNAIGTINNSLAILISTSSVVTLKFATQLQTLPVNLFGTSIALAVLPTLSLESDDADKDKFKKTFLTSLHQMFFLVMPASIILIVLRIPVVRLVYGVANFPWEATVQTAYAVAFFAISIFSQSAVYIVTRAFYALKDTSTPVKASLFTIFINVLLSLLFVRVLGFGVWSLALSFSLTSYLDLSIMMYLLSRKVGGFDLARVLIPFVKISYSALMMGFCLYVPLKLLDRFVFDTTKTVNLILLTGIAGLSGMAAYLFFTKILKVGEIDMFYQLVRKLKFEKTPEVTDAEATSN